MPRGAIGRCCGGGARVVVVTCEKEEGVPRGVTRGGGTFVMAPQGMSRFSPVGRICDETFW